MWLPENHRFQIVEVARYVAKLDAVIRQQDRKTGEPILYRWDEDLQSFISNNNNKGIYSSVFRYENTSIKTCRILGNLYFDLDSANDVDLALIDARKLYSYLNTFIHSDSIRCYFTGFKGFHVEVEAVAVGYSPSKELAKDFRFIAKNLSEELNLHTLDFSVYDRRRMWRIAGSQHQKTGLHKIRIDEDILHMSCEQIKDKARHESAIAGPLSDQSFQYEANAWFKQWMVKQDEILAQRAQKRVDLFNKIGTKLIQKPEGKYAQKIWNRSMKILSEQPKGDRNNALNREGFNLYMLAYKGCFTEDQVTEALTDMGVTMGLRSREVQRTLDSARAAAQSKYDQLMPL